MRDWQSQTHVKWEGKYHVVFIPKYRKKKMHGALRKQLGHIFRQLCLQKGVELLDIIEDSGIDQGGCLLETNLGTIDAKIDTQFEQVKQALNLV